jgi:hypothetical protein
LTIESGTTVKGKKSPVRPAPSTLIFRRDSKINAVGTSAQPIVMTSDQPAGSRAPGDWGGLVINGRGPVNCPGNECLAEGLDSVPFGGTETNDSSGIFRFLRVEFAGKIVSTDNELNVITMNGLGRGTTADHIMANQGLDDTIEWFGGNINMKFLVSGGSADDNFDWQLGTTGAFQYGFAWQYAPNLQNTGNMGWEADNNENGRDLLPRSKPRFCNFTLVGARGQAGQDAAQESYGWLARQGTAGQIGNSIVTNFKSAGIQLRDPETAAVACNAGPTLTGQLLMKNSSFFGNGTGGTVQCLDHSSTTGANCSSCSLYNLWKTQASGPVFEADPQFVNLNPTNYTGATPDPRPQNAAFTNNNFDCKTFDSTFDTTGYVGAFQPGQPIWMTAPWVSFAIN